ncbi:MAG: DUF6882 domain-containing protein [Cyanobacteria bacterium P01_G01_bin.4]
MASLCEQLSIHIATAFSQQLALSDFLREENSWGIDIGAATVDFGDGRVYPIQLLGTKSEL